jgi:RNA-directed DNA polymerase
VNADRLTTPQEKVRELQEKLGHAAKMSRRRRFHALYDKVYRLDVLQEAWRRIRSNKGAAGIDKQTLQDIEDMGVQRFLLSCQQTLKEGTYHPKPVRRKYIPKKDGRMRPLGIPTVKDRVIQMATKLVIEPIFEANFKECSFGFRPGRSAKQALERVRKACNRKGNWVVDVDIQGYFDNINQEKLMKLVAMRISDRRIQKLIRKWLEAGVMEEGNVKHTELGTPQGGVISPLLANIYLNYFDTLWERHGAGIGELTRYADDFVIVCKTRKDAMRAMEIVKAIMARLELTLHPTKTRIVGMWTGVEGFDFLGMHHRKTKAQSSMFPKGISSWCLWIGMAAPPRFPLWKLRTKNSKNFTMRPRLVLTRSNKKKSRISVSVRCMKKTCGAMWASHLPSPSKYFTTSP